MSYILDALRKSDQQRQRGAMPTLQMAQLSTAEPRTRENWMYALIAVILVVAGIAIGWLHGGQSESGPAAASPVSGASITAQNMATNPTDAGRSPGTATAVAPVPAAPAISADSPQASPAPQWQNQTRQSAVQSTSAQASAESVRPQETPAPAHAPGAPIGTADASRRQPRKDTAADVTPTAREARVMRIGELPESIRQEIPDMQISLHLYSTRPGNSFVSINNQMLQEGASVAPGLKLEKITPDGMVFSYKGYRFRRGVH